MSSSFKVLFVLPNFGRNGAVDFVIDLANAMVVNHGHVEILGLEGVEREERAPLESVVVTVAARRRAGGPRNPSRWRRFEQILRLPGLLFQTLRAVSRSDVVVLTWEKGPALLLPSLAAFILRKPTVAIVQNNVDRSLHDYSRINWRRAMCWAYNRAQAVVCISKDQVAILNEIGIGDSNIVVIPNGIDVERVRALSTDAPVTALPADTVPYIVGVGRLSSQKGFDLLIKAHARVRENKLDHRLVLVGDGPDENALKSLAEECGVSDSVVFLGFVRNPYPILARSTLYCLSSRYEGRPLALAESASLGVPVVAADCPTGPREILADGLYGELVEPESVDGLAEAIESHLRDPLRLKQMARACARNADRLSIKTCADRHIRLLSQWVLQGESVSKYV